jgi:hypothetical protein
VEDVEGCLQTPIIPLKQVYYVKAGDLVMLLFMAGLEDAYYA